MVARTADIYWTGGPDKETVAKVVGRRVWVTRQDSPEEIQDRAIASEDANRKSLQEQKEADRKLLQMYKARKRVRREMASRQYVFPFIEPVYKTKPDRKLSPEERARLRKASIKPTALRATWLTLASDYRKRNRKHDARVCIEIVKYHFGVISLP